MTRSPLASPEFSEYYREEAVASGYDSARTRSYKQRLVRDIEKVFFSEALGGARRVLEIGAGTGEITSAVFAGRELTAIDLSSEMLARAREKLPLVDFRQLDMFDLEALDDTFDAIMSSRVFLHLEASELCRILVLCAAKLRPGGTLVFDVERRSLWRSMLSYFERHKVRNYPYNRLQLLALVRAAGLEPLHLVSFDHWIPLAPLALISGTRYRRGVFYRAERRLFNTSWTAGRWGVICRRPL